MLNSRDFTLRTFQFLINSLKKYNYHFLTYEKFVNWNNLNKVVVMRHDVDHKPENAVKMAQLEKDMGISASYFIGQVNNSYSKNAINCIVKMGHELGYHYNDLAMSNGSFEKAFESFKRNLAELRLYYPVRTMCMHGSPLSKWDNRLLWAKYNYRELGIISEPYLDINFNDILYLTDASRAWNNANVTIRDKVDTKFNFHISNTFDIIKLLELNKLPDKLLINIHPHNWAKNRFEWIIILLWQGIKNQIKKLMIKMG